MTISAYRNSLLYDWPVRRTSMLIPFLQRILGAAVHHFTSFLYTPLVLKSEERTVRYLLQARFNSIAFKT